MIKERGRSMRPSRSYRVRWDGREQALEVSPLLQQRRRARVGGAAAAAARRLSPPGNRHLPGWPAAPRATTASSSRASSLPGMENAAPGPSTLQSLARRCDRPRATPFTRPPTGQERRACSLSPADDASRSGTSASTPDATWRVVLLALPQRPRKEAAGVLPPDVDLLPSFLLPSLSTPPAGLPYPSFPSTPASLARCIVRRSMF